MTTPPWTPPGEGLPDPPAASRHAPTGPPAYQPYPSYQPHPSRQPAYPGGPHPDGIPLSKARAGWALGLALVGCIPIALIVAVVLAITVLVDSAKDARDRGKGMAVAALWISGAWVAILAVSVAASLVSPGDPEPPVRGAEDGTAVDSVTGKELPKVAPSELVVGQCLDDPQLHSAGTEEVRTFTVTLVPCERLHDLEAYWLFELDGEEYPGERDLSRKVGKGCTTPFEAYVGMAYGRSRLEFWAYYPTETMWELADDHGVVCVVGDPRRKTAGSLQHSRK